MKAIDFCCGAGGMTYGLELAGIKVLYGIDIDPTCKETYEFNNKNSKFLEKNLTEITCEELKSETNIKQNDDNLIFAACTPCQYWTKIQTSKSKAASSKKLIKEFKKFVEYFRPGYIVIENVPGVYNNKKESGLKAFIDSLSKNNYVYDEKIVNMVYYGVPQKRRRYIMIATRTKESVSLPAEEENKDLTVRKFIGDRKLFIKRKDGYNDKTKYDHSTALLSEKNRKRIRKTKANGGNRSRWQNDPNLSINAYKDKKKIFADVYNRMWWDKPAPTITTKFHSLSNGRFGHPEQHRALSIREGAWLQTFPLTYEFKHHSLVVKARHIGNAVPPEMAYRIGKYIIDIEQEC